MRRLLLLTIFIPILVFTGIASASGVTLHVVAYSAPKAIVHTLVTNWQGTPQGNGVGFTESYGASSSQAQAIVAGQPADIAFLSNALDIQTLVHANLVVGNWQKKLPQNGFVANSVVAFAVRPGNPKGIHTWADLAKPGVQVVTPDPFPSGGAKWNVLGMYGAMRKKGMSDAKATKFVESVFKNVVSQPTSASAAMSAFVGGQGDVLLTYESEAYAAQLAGKSLDIVVPKPDILIQLPMVPIIGAPAQASQFIAYDHTKDAQKLFVQGGYRPVVASVLNDPSLASWKHKFATGPTFTVADKVIGGWTKAYNTWFSNPNGRMIKIEQDVGGPTS